MTSNWYAWIIYVKPTRVYNVYRRQKNANNDFTIKGMSDKFILIIWTSISTLNTQEQILTRSVNYSFCYCHKKILQNIYLPILRLLKIVDNVLSIITFQLESNYYSFSVFFAYICLTCPTHSFTIGLNCAFIPVKCFCLQRCGHSRTSTRP